MCSRRKILSNTRTTEEKVNQGKERKKEKERSTALEVGTSVS